MLVALVKEVKLGVFSHGGAVRKNILYSLASRDRLNKRGGDADTLDEIRTRDCLNQ
mgnify:CR=1 FL=1